MASKEIGGHTRELIILGATQKNCRSIIKFHFNGSFLLYCQIELIRLTFNTVVNQSSSIKSLENVRTKSKKIFSKILQKRLKKYHVRIDVFSYFDNKVSKSQPCHLKREKKKDHRHLVSEM